MFDNLTTDNMFLYAVKAYDKPNAIMSEFDEDYSRFLYIKRLLTKYYTTGVLKERLILNHLVLLYNVFGVEAATRLIFAKFEDKDYEVLKPFLLYLHYLPEIVKGICGKDIYTNDIKMDENIIKCLRIL